MQPRLRRWPRCNWQSANVNDPAGSESEIMQRANSVPAPTKVEYAVKPVLRFIVTRWSDSEGSEVIGEFPSSHQACRVAFGLPNAELCKNTSARGVWSNLDEEFEDLMKSIDERAAESDRRRAEVMEQLRPDLNPAATVV